MEHFKAITLLMPYVSAKHTAATTLAAPTRNQSWATIHEHFLLPFRSKKAIPVTGHGSPQGSETSRLPHFLDNRLTDDREVVSFIC
jgi:hypothetical protein